MLTKAFLFVAVSVHFFCLPYLLAAAKTPSPPNGTDTSTRKIISSSSLAAKTTFLSKTKTTTPSIANSTLTISIKPTALPGGCVPDEQYQCKNKKCIPIEWMCDYAKDCRGGEDEENCTYFNTCYNGDLLCRSGECIESHKKCDGHNDCTDGYDEKFCSASGKHIPHHAFIYAFSTLLIVLFSFY